MNKKLTVKQKRIVWTGSALAVMVILCWIINGSFLVNFYQDRTITAMEHAYVELNDAAGLGLIDTDQFDVTLQAICEKNNINIIIIDQETETLKSSNRNYDMMSKDLMGYIFRIPRMSRDTVLLSTSNYEIHKVIEPVYNIEYLDLWGILDNGYLFLIRSPMEGIRESVRISTGYFNYIIIVLFVALCLGLFFSLRRLTIEELERKNKELQFDIKKREEIEKMRSEFISNISHELKTPIALIKGYAEGLKESVNKDDESRNYYCEVIMDESEKMNNVVIKLLELNHLEFGKNYFKYEKFDIVEVIKSYIKGSAILYESKDINVIFDYNEPIYVWADEYYTGVVFDNFFSNAINHADYDKNIEIKISLVDEENSDKGICRKAYIYVFNTGDPIPEESINNIWEKFYKVDKARTREYGGSGVGLSIVKAIMDSMNQNYGVENFSDGVRFYFTLDAEERVKP